MDNQKLKDIMAQIKIYAKDTLIEFSHFERWLYFLHQSKY